VLQGEILNTGDTEKVKVGFQYREYAGFVEELYSDKWTETETIGIETGEFSLKPNLKKEGKTYQFRAFVEHPKLRVYGDIKRVNF
jgi:alpha-L-fucosidase